MKINELNLTKIKETTSKVDPRPLGIFNEYSVLIPLLKLNDEKLHLLFQIRSKDLENQPGEISFPGGALEKGENFLEACTRETCEELNINKSDLEVFGRTDYIITPYNTMIIPFVGFLKNIIPARLNFNKDEVEEIFTVPLKYFLKTPPELHYVELEPKTSANFPFDRIPGGKNYPFKTGKYPVYFYQYKDYSIWGVTARLVNNFVQICLKT